MCCVLCVECYARKARNGCVFIHRRYSITNLFGWTSRVVLEYYYRIGKRLVAAPGDCFINGIFTLFCPNVCSHSPDVITVWPQKQEQALVAFMGRTWCGMWPQERGCKSRGLRFPDFKNSPYYCVLPNAIGLHGKNSCANGLLTPK